VFIGLVQVKYQNTQSSPFDTHGLIMLLFILVLVAKVYTKYLLEMSQPIANTSYFPITKFVCQISGVLACGLLLSILLPPFWCWIILFSSVFHSIREIHHSFHDIFVSLQEIYQQNRSYEWLHCTYRQISESLHIIYQQIRIYEWLYCINQKISESLHIIYQQLYEWLHGIYQKISGILGRVFKKLYDAFQWILNPTQHINENSVKQEGGGGCPRVQVV
jgi:hypothetical protein